jgi:hypothetical protein
MKSRSTTGKTPGAASHRAQYASAGRNSVALAPPAYGIDFVDSAKTGEAMPGALNSALPTSGRTPGAGAGRVIQGYFVQSYLTSSNDWLLADDMTVAAEKGYPNHTLYAKAGKVTAANAKLAGVNSGVQLVETTTTARFWKGSNALNNTKLNKVEAKNRQNDTYGDHMKLYADCGQANAAVVGGEKRQAIYDKPGGAAATKVAGDPRVMKIAIIRAWMAEEKKTASDENRPILERIDLQAALAETELEPLVEDYAAAAGDVAKKAALALYKKKLDDIAVIYWKYYNAQSEQKRDDIDKALKINRYAAPDVGQGYTISSGGASAGKSTWNFHWGGVVMASDDNNDKVVLENYAVGKPDEENERWTFDVYGTEKKGQTFHERHADTKQHGKTPTTMSIEKIKP